METLLDFDEFAALVGDDYGEVHTDLRKDNESIEDWHRKLQEAYEMPGWTITDKNYVPFPRVAGLYETEDRHVHIFQWAEEPILVKMHEDNDRGLKAEAAFDSSIGVWVVVRRPNENLQSELTDEQ